VRSSDIAVLRGHEEVSEGKAAVNKLLVVLGTNVVHGRRAIVLDEGGEGSLGEHILKDALVVIKLLEQQHSGGLNSELGEALGVSGDSKEVVLTQGVASLSEGQVLLAGLALKEPNNNNTLTGREDSDLVSGQDGHGGKDLPGREKRKKEKRKRKKKILRKKKLPKASKASKIIVTSIGHVMKAHKRSLQSQ